VLCVNLMKKSKEQEQMITEGFETHIKNNNLGKILRKLNKHTAENLFLS